MTPNLKDGTDSQKSVNTVILPLIRIENVNHRNDRGLAVPIHIKLLTALRFYATGSMQASIKIYLSKL